jgi:hypothetical protein
VERASIARRPPRALVAVAGAAVTLVAMLAGWYWTANGSGTERGGPALRVVQVVRAEGVDIALLSAAGTLRQGANRFVIEFRRPGTETLVDPGTVRASAAMAMPGMVMSSGLQVRPTAVRGRFEATAEFGMAGAWQMAIDWDGPAGRGAARFEGGVQ